MKGLLAALTLLLISAAVAATAAAGQDRSITSAELGELSARASGAIPIEGNELVLAQLNRLVGTAGARGHFKTALSRLERYRPMLRKTVEKYHLPDELMVVPILESGYRNVRNRQGAGLWSFVKRTARRYGLKVRKGLDERMNEEKETDAAMRYLRDLHALFGDWRLALKAYNEGDGRVNQMIREQGTRDPWALERASPGQSYLSSVAAAIVVLKNPKLLD